MMLVSLKDVKFSLRRHFVVLHITFKYESEKKARLHNCLGPKIQQTKMLVMCQRFGDWFLFGLVWPYSSNQKNIMKVGSKSLLLTCSSTKL